MKNYIFSHYEKYIENGDNILFLDRPDDINSSRSNDDLRVFFKSKLRNIPDSHLLFFSNLILDKRYENIEIINTDRFDRIYIPACDRFRMYLQYINENRFDEDSNFVFCDCRDLVFHKDVFKLLKYYPNNVVIFGNESCEFPLNFEPNNKNWLLHQNILNYGNFGFNLIICSGIFIIRGLELTKLLLQHYEILLKYYIKIAKREGINDQGIFNELYYNSLKNYQNNVIVLRNEQNPLFVHLSLCENKYCNYNNGKFSFLDRNLEPCILHQYDRHGNLFSEFRKEYLNN